MTSFYDLGAADDADAVGDRHVTPGAIRDEMETVSAIIRQLQSDIASSPVPAKLKSDFQAFVAEWNRFAAEHEPWTARLWPITYDKVLDYRRRAADWRKAFESTGGPPAAPAVPQTATTAMTPVAPALPTPQPQLGTSQMPTAGWLLVAAATGLAVGAVLTSGSRE